MPAYRVVEDDGRQIDLDAHRVTRVGDVLVFEDISTATGQWQKVARVPLARVQSVRDDAPASWLPVRPQTPHREGRDEEQVR
ncbi:hypothetical protein GCM10022262_34230 [Georgenia daeguensis]|uniref:Uncharacterized protein n=1 Tax=Georgenia daeguensis TaxID=908355 RepID=A0ABP8EZB7_9MICO